MDSGWDVKLDKGLQRMREDNGKISHAEAGRAWKGDFVRKDKKETKEDGAAGGMTALKTMKTVSRILKTAGARATRPRGASRNAQCTMMAGGEREECLTRREGGRRHSA